MIIARIISILNKLSLISKDPDITYKMYKTNIDNEFK